MKKRVLVVDDDAALREMLQSHLNRQGFAVTTVDNAERALTLAQEDSFDVVLTDLRLPQASGTELCHRLSQSRPDVPVVVITGFGSMDSAVEAIRAGAYDYVTKPLDLNSLDFAVRRAVEHRELRGKLRRLEEEAPPSDLGGLLGESKAIQEVRRLLERLGESSTTVMITGESGTGKEIAATTIHEVSRRPGRFIAINCAALPAPLLESELFGHVKGAFTDAKSDRTGLFVQANQGTLLLDEVGEMPPEMQAKLLRVLQEQEVRPVGGDRSIPFNTRIIAATNRNLEADVRAGRFREDLYFRLNVVELKLPPLRERGNDVLLLAQHFLRKETERGRKKVLGISEPVAQALLNYRWPGNVRELQNIIQRAVALARFDQLVLDDLPPKLTQPQPDRHDTRDRAKLLPLREMERKYLMEVLDAVEGNKALAARILGVDRRTLYRKLERYDVGLAEDGMEQGY